MANDATSTAGTGDSSSLITEQVKQGTQQAAQQAQQAGGQVLDTAKQRGVGMLTTQKDKATDVLETIALALRQTGQNLTQQHNNVGQYFNQAADRLESTNGYIKNSNVEDLLTDVEGWGRSHQTAFLGGSFALGLLAARFLKSSSPSSNVGYTGTSYGGSGSYNDTANSTSFSSGGSGTYDYSNVQYGTDNVGGSPDVQREYAPGLMGTTEAGNGS